MNPADPIEPPRPPDPGQVIPTGHVEPYQPGGLIDDGPLNDRLNPPEEAERAYIAALLWRDDANEVMYRSVIEPSHFLSPQYAAIYEAMIAVRDRGERVHFLTVAEELANIDTEVVMWQSTDRGFNTGWVDFYADQVLARYRRRAVKDLGGALTEIATVTPGPELDAAVESSVAGVLSGPGVRHVDLASTTLESVAFVPSDAEQPLLTPWPVLNRAIEGFLGGSLYVLSGDTGSGKSAIALQIATSLSAYGTCLYFTMEMGAREQQQRVIAQQTATSLRMVRAQHYPPGPVRDRVEHFVRHNNVRIGFDDRANLSVSEIRRVALGTSGLAAVVVDQLSLMDIGKRTGENLTDAIARTTSALKAMAMDLRIPVIMLSQLNREAARSGRPTRHHLYGSSAIANDGDVILILHRENRERLQDLTLIVDKNRQGEEGELELEWQGEFVRAVDPSA